MNILPSRFQRITAFKNPLVKRLERLRTSKDARRTEGHVLVQGIKTLEELSSKRHSIRTIGITFDEQNLPIRSPALDIVASIRRQEAEDEGRMNRINGDRMRKGDQSPHHKPRFQADHFVAMSQSLTTKILGTDSPTGQHEVWAEVAIPNHDAAFSIEADNSKSNPYIKSPDIHKLIVLDQILDPGNMGLIIRSAKALSWDAAWHTPGTVDQYNDKVIRASRALCLDWPTKTAGWKELEKFINAKNIILLVADMVPEWISERETLDTSLPDIKKKFNPYNLIWWNWPKTLSQSQVPEKIALVMSSEHHGVKGKNASFDSEEQAAKARLLGKAIRVSIPMNPDVESMNVAAAATTMMWELNRVIDEGKIGKLQLISRSEE
ncbi:hypothetical protein BGZ76_005451 [Entomortierella beljakovae]|nr:hypothetical protein BGZ76_005451 [Entomortierella beljakovae]